MLLFCLSEVNVDLYTTLYMSDCRIRHRCCVTMVTAKPPSGPLTIFAYAVGTAKQLTTCAFDRILPPEVSRYLLTVRICLNTAYEGKFGRYDPCLATAV